MSIEARKHTTQYVIPPQAQHSRCYVLQRQLSFVNPWPIFSVLLNTETHTFHYSDLKPPNCVCHLLLLDGAVWRSLLSLRVFCAGSLSGRR